MKKTTLLLATVALLFGGSFANAQNTVKDQNATFKVGSDLMTPEALWAMGRIGGATASPDGKQVVYQVGYYSVKQNKSQQMLFVMDADGKNKRQLTTGQQSETDGAWIEQGRRIAFITGGQLWSMNADGSDRKQLTNSSVDIEGFKFSPDERKVILIKSLPYHGTIQANPADLPLATGRLATDMNYRHWDHYVETIAHPFVADYDGSSINEGVDVLQGEPFECPTAPFGGTEQLAWSPDSKSIAYTCRKKEGVQYAISTDTDIYLYDVATRKTKNLCKPSGYKEPAIDATKSMKNQAVNHQPGDMNVGYDTNPQFSSDGKYIAWQSMAHNGYESDRNRLCVYTLANGTKNYVTEQFDSNVDAYCWGNDNNTFYFIGVWHGKTHVYQTNLKGQIKQLTDGQYDYGSLQLLGRKGQLLVTRHSMSHPDDLFVLTPSKKEKRSQVTQITDENKHIFDQLAIGKVEERWTKTTDGKDMLSWIVLPPHFDANKKYPTLLFCEGGPQSPVSQFWSYRWNLQIMAAHGYIVVAPNRRGLPGFGSAWNEEISGDWTGQCMNDYLSAIDDAANNLPYVDKDRLGAVGASFGGFSVYYLAGHHDKRFKCFISHDGAFNLESMYTDTEEAWFSNWEYEDAYWNKDQTANAKRTYQNSPHQFVDKWDTPILCIHGEKDYRINANQGMGAFNAARLRGIPAELLIFPDENHWVLKPQNGILWQRTFFNWLDRWLKK
ncbi:peptidase, S9A/B/C family, catalytic domain protein [Hoylesella buccalis ATCC 35310]|uniref:Peptidase, S9A/B/C family, catalytic domain protein n=1 Tax=Hoylesella buccalis ATCC 35310 TaxID=679190 RepID=D1W9A3_9BACT|nr:S9 family peptidase [Hoylesella buccalis]EFA90866.1 peptidase, S9A/B/C family, catalytic domain protein [Hoylesella buccalis ATCC 35310]